MARTSARSKWQAYAERTGTDMGEFFNRNIRETLKVGIEALVKNTVHDSSRAANHWVIIPNKGKVNPGSWKEMTFQPTHGVSPVGRIGDGGTNRGLTIKAVTSRETHRSINKAVAGREPASVFRFQNNIPGQYNDQDGGKAAANGQNYRLNAGLSEARAAAESVMQVKFNSLIAAGKVRVNRL